MPVLLDLIFNALFAVFEGTILSGGGQGGGRKPGKIEAGGGREAGGTERNAGVM